MVTATRVHVPAPTSQGGCWRENKSQNCVALYVQKSDYKMLQVYGSTLQRNPLLALFTENYWTPACVIRRLDQLSSGVNVAALTQESAWFANESFGKIFSIVFSQLL